MPITTSDHLKIQQNRCHLILLSDSQLDLKDCADTLILYGSINKLQLTPDNRAAFVDFECEHAPPLVARIYEIHKRKAEVPMPRGTSLLLPGCSIKNYLYLQHVPHSLPTDAITRYFFTWNNRLGNVTPKPVIVHRPRWKDGTLYSRAVVQLTGTTASEFHKGGMQIVQITSNGRHYQFYAVPQLDALLRGVCDNDGCEECNVVAFRESIEMEDREAEALERARMAGHVTNYEDGYGTSRASPFPEITDDVEKRKWGIAGTNQVPPPPRPSQPVEAHRNSPVEMPYREPPATLSFPSESISCEKREEEPNGYRYRKPPPFPVQLNLPRQQQPSYGGVGVSADGYAPQLQYPQRRAATAERKDDTVASIRQFAGPAPTFSMPGARVAAREEDSSSDESRETPTCDDLIEDGEEAPFVPQSSAREAPATASEAGEGVKEEGEALTHKELMGEEERASVPLDSPIDGTQETAGREEGVKEVVVEESVSSMIEESPELAQRGEIEEEFVSSSLGVQRRWVADVPLPASEEMSGHDTLPAVVPQSNALSQKEEDVIVEESEDSIIEERPQMNEKGEIGEESIRPGSIFSLVGPSDELDSDDLLSGEEDESRSRVQSSLFTRSTTLSQKEEDVVVEESDESMIEERLQMNEKGEIEEESPPALSREIPVDGSDVIVSESGSLVDGRREEVVAEEREESGEENESTHPVSVYSLAGPTEDLDSDDLQSGEEDEWRSDSQTAVVTALSQKKEEVAVEESDDSMIEECPEVNLRRDIDQESPPALNGKILVDRSDVIVSESESLVDGRREEVVVEEREESGEKGVEKEEDDSIRPGSVFSLVGPTEELDSDDLLSGEEDESRSIGTWSFSRNNRAPLTVESTLNAMEKEKRLLEAAAGDGPQMAMMVEEEEEEVKDIADRTVDAMHSLAPPSTVPLDYEDTVSSRVARSSNSDEDSIDYDTSESNTVPDESSDTVGGGEGGDGRFLVDPEEWGEMDQMIMYAERQRLSTIEEDSQEEDAAQSVCSSEDVFVTDDESREDEKEEESINGVVDQAEEVEEDEGEQRNLSFLLAALYCNNGSELDSDDEEEKEMDEEGEKENEETESEERRGEKPGASLDATTNEKAGEIVEREQRAILHSYSSRPNINARVSEEEDEREPRGASPSLYPPFYLMRRSNEVDSDDEEEEEEMRDSDDGEGVEMEEGKEEKDRHQPVTLSSIDSTTSLCDEKSEVDSDDEKKEGEKKDSDDEEAIERMEENVDEEEGKVEGEQQVTLLAPFRMASFDGNANDEKERDTRYPTVLQLNRTSEIDSDDEEELEMDEEGGSKKGKEEQRDSLPSSSPIVSFDARASEEEKMEREQRESSSTPIASLASESSEGMEQEIAGVAHMEQRAPIRRWSRMSVGDQVEEEEDRRSVMSEYHDWLTREDGRVKEDPLDGSSSDTETEIVPLPSSLPTITWGIGIVVDEKTTVDSTVLPKEKESLIVMAKQAFDSGRINVFGKATVTSLNKK